MSAPQSSESTAGRLKEYAGVVEGVTTKMVLVAVALVKSTVSDGVKTTEMTSTPVGMTVPAAGL
jgi:hypothetical protein